MTASVALDWAVDRVVVEVAGGVTVYPARGAGDRWRAVWYEGGRRRQCESVSEAGWPRSWRRSLSGWRRTRRGWNAPGRT